MPKKTLENIANLKNIEAIIQVKANQPKLLDSCKQIANSKHDDIDLTKERSRGRVEEREVRVFFKDKFEDLMVDKYWNNYLKAIIEVRRKTFKLNAKTKLFDESFEIAYYVSTTRLDAKKFNKAIRGHWGIENKNHYVKDVSMNEDNSRIRKNPDIFAKLRSFALNSMRKNEVDYISRQMYVNSLNVGGFLERYRWLFEG